MGTKEGGSTLTDTMIKKYGSREAWGAAMREVGRKGGMASHPEKGFGSNIECDCGWSGTAHLKRQCSGAKGGAISRRGKAKKSL